MNVFDHFLVEHFWLVAIFGFFVSMVLGFLWARRPNSFARRWARACDAFWRVLTEEEAEARKR